MVKLIENTVKVFKVMIIGVLCFGFGAVVTVTAREVINPDAIQIQEAALQEKDKAVGETEAKVKAKKQEVTTLEQQVKEKSEALKATEKK